MQVMEGAGVYLGDSLARSPVAAWRQSLAKDRKNAPTRLGRRIFASVEDHSAGTAAVDRRLSNDQAPAPNVTTIKRPPTIERFFMK